MEKQEFSKQFQKQLESFEIVLTQEKIDKFYKYMFLLLDWNENINLTAITKPEEVIEKHFVDSLTIQSYIPKNSKVIDVGTGAGFPGIPLKILREDIEITLLDSLQKRINFLDEVIQQLNLEKIQTVHSRAEDAGQLLIYREKFDIATSRAVANMSTLSEYLIPFVKINGKAVFMKGNNIEEELEMSKKAISLLRGKIQEVVSVTLPNSESRRNIILVEKNNSTPKKYPRNQGKPSKNPL